MAGTRRIYYPAALLVLLMALLLCWASFHPRALEPVKELTVRVNQPDGTISSTVFETNAHTLRDALEGNVTLELTNDSRYGWLLYGVNGSYADTSANTAWTWLVNGSVPGAGMKDFAVSDGDVIDFYIYSW